MSASAGGGARSRVAGPLSEVGWAATRLRGRSRLGCGGLVFLFFLIQIPIPKPIKTATNFEFKPRFESYTHK
jgi:hypothetical protein